MERDLERATGEARRAAARPELVESPAVATGADLAADLDVPPGRRGGLARVAPHPAAARPSRLRGALRIVGQWFDAEAGAGDAGGEAGAVQWLRIVPFLALHLGCLAVLWVGVSWVAVAVCGALYLVRMFAITAFYHRYFSHRAFATSRGVQFTGALLAGTSAQRGPLWWAAHHRMHHKHSDTERDVHSPLQGGFWWSQVGWFTTSANFATDHTQIRDFARFPELRFLNRFDWVAPALLGTAVWGLGIVLEAFPALGTDRWQMFVWGFVVSTVLLFHGTSFINSLGHILGRRRYETGDGSRNSWLLALLTLGEGWHNNHHHYPVSVRQGFRWWELDVTYHALQLMAALGLVWDLRPVPAHVVAGARPVRRGDGHRRAG